MKFTISKDEFSKIHNAKCDLFFALQNLEGVLSEQVTQRLKKALDGLDAGLAGVYQQEDKIFKERQQLHNEISSKHKLRTIWSMYEVTKFDEVPFPGARTMSYLGNTIGISSVSTWLHLWIAADRLIKASGDDHHIFIEDFHRSGDNLEICTGS